MNLEEKILQATKIIEHVASRNHMGPFNGQMKVVSVLKAILNNKQIISDTITSEDVTILRTLTFTAEEIKALEKARSKSRNTIEAIMARLMDEENFRQHKITDTITSARKSGKSSVLKPEEIEFLQSGNCSIVDINYVFTHTRLNAVEALLDMTALNATRAFKYIGSLDGPATTSLSFNLQNHISSIENYAIEQAKSKLSVDEIIENLIAEVKAGNRSLNLEYIDLVSTKNLRDRLQTQIDNGILTKPKIKYLKISPTYKQNIPQIFNHWTSCANNTNFCLTTNDLIKTWENINNALTFKNEYRDPSTYFGIDYLLEKTAYYHTQNNPNSSIYVVHHALQDIRRSYNISFETAAEAILDVLTRNKTQAFNISVNIKDYLGSVRMTYVYIGCERNRMITADKLAAQAVPTDVALRVTARTSSENIDNLADILTQNISPRHLAMIIDTRFEELSEAQLSALDYMQSLGIDISTALPISHAPGAEAILNHELDTQFSNYTMAMKFLNFCNSTGMSQLVSDGNDLLNKIAYDILLIPIAKALLDCVDQQALPAPANLFIAAGQSESFSTETNNNITTSLALIGIGIATFATASCLFFKKKHPTAFKNALDCAAKFSPIPLAREKAYNLEQSQNRHGKKK